MRWIMSLVFLFAYVASSFASVALQVHLPEQQLRADFSEPSRLYRVLDYAHSQADTPLEPLQAQLFDLNENAQQQNAARYQKLVEDLARLQQLKPHLNTQGLQKQLQASTFLPRVFTSLDADIVQTQGQFNYLLQGEYQLNIGPRDEHIYIFGIGDAVQVLSQQSTWFFVDYLNQLAPLSKGVSQSRAVVIQPDGKVIEIAFATWNFQAHFIAPGALVYLPFSHLPLAFKQLNEQVVELLRHRVKPS